MQEKMTRIPALYGVKRSIASREMMGTQSGSMRGAYIKAGGKPAERMRAGL